MRKLFDLRFVIGSFFSVVGLILIIYGFLSTDRASNAHLTNKWCGGIFIVFGILMIILSFGRDAHDELLEE
jgi:hypothetical protein